MDAGLDQRAQWLSLGRAIAAKTTLSAFRKTFRKAKKPFSVIRKVFLISEKGLWKAKKVFSMTKRTFLTIKKVFRMTEKVLWKAEKVFRMTERASGKAGRSLPPRVCLSPALARPVRAVRLARGR